MSNHTERKRDEALRETFPASDPPANSGITGAEPEKHDAGSNPGSHAGGPSRDRSGAPAEEPLGEPPAKPSNERSIAERPTGRPTSDRHATETANHWEHHGEEDTRKSP